MPESGSEEVPREASEYVEWALEKAGGSGPFQYTHILGLGLVWAYYAHMCYLALFAGMPVQIRPVDCHGNDCITTQPNCDVPREQWHVNNPGQTYIATFDLICERSPLAPLLPTIFFFGATFGVIAGGSWSDKYGRKNAYALFLAAQQFGVLGQVLAQNYILYASAVFLTGFGAAAFGLAAYVWQGEMLGKELRSVMAWAPNVFFSVGQILLSLLAMFLPQWRRLTLAEFFIGCGFFGLLGILEESPKWLATQGRVHEAHRVLCSCARANGRAEPSPPNPISAAGPSTQIEKQEAAAPAGVMGQLLDKRLFSRFVIMCFAWFATSMGYYGLSFNAASLPLSIHLANIVSGATCIPAYLIAGFLVDWPPCGRKGVVSGGFLMSGACLLASCFGTPFQLVVLYYVAVCSVSLSFAVIYVWGSELFPTDIRGSAMGLQSICARAGAMLAPAVASLGDKNHTGLPLLVFAMPCIIAGLWTLFLPETRGQPLPDTIADVGREATFAGGHVAGEPLAGKGNPGRWYGSAGRMK